MGPRGLYTEGMQDFIFALLFVVTGPALARFLFRKTRCHAAAMLVGIGMISAATGLTFLGIAAWQYVQENSAPYTPFAMAALVCQMGGAAIMTGALVFTHEYAKKLHSAGAVDPTLISTSIGIRSRCLAEAPKEREFASQ